MKEEWHWMCVLAEKTERVRRKVIQHCTDRVADVSPTYRPPGIPDTYGVLIRV